MHPIDDPDHEERSYTQQTNTPTISHPTEHQRAIVCLPSLIREPTTLESLSNTFQSFSLAALTSTFRHTHSINSSTYTNAHRPPAQPLLSPTSPSIRPEHPPHEHDHSSAVVSVNSLSPATDDDIIFSRWCSSPHHSTLLLTLTPTGFRCWNTDDLEGLVELFWIRFDQISPSPLCSPDHHSPREHPHPVLSATSQPHFSPLRPVSVQVLPWPGGPDPSSLMFAVLFNLPSGSCPPAHWVSSRLIIVSARSGSVLGSLDLRGSAVDLKLNRSHIVVATKSPAALHLIRYSSTSRAGANTTNTDQAIVLSQLPCSPILDLTPRPTTGEPVFTLGPSRLLCYASSKPPSDREPRIATASGFSLLGPHSEAARSPDRYYNNHSNNDCRAGSDLNQASHTLSAYSHSHRLGLANVASGNSWKNSVAPNLDSIDEAARKVGGGLISGARRLGSWGQTFWTGSNPHHSIDPSAHQHTSAPPDSTITFSQSAPSAHTWLPRAYDAHDHNQLTTVADHFASFGNVKVIDLSNSMQPIFHFKPSSDPLTVLSLNPSSNLLLTSSIEGHSFHVFELRPRSSIGKSCTSAHRRRLVGSQRVPTVWHRYKLTRGFTAAEVSDVVWRWDSRVVSVLTEHGTHHLYAIHPAGGFHNPTGEIHPRANAMSSSIFSIATSNPNALQPLSVTIAAFEKIKPKSGRLSVQSTASTNSHTAPVPIGNPTPNKYFDQPIDPSENPTTNMWNRRLTFLTFTKPGQARISGKALANREDHQQILSEPQHRYPSGLLFDPMNNSVTLYNFELKKKLIGSMTSGVGVSLAKNMGIPHPNASHAQSHRHTPQPAFSPPSGLSQLMMRKTHKGLEPASDADHDSLPDSTNHSHSNLISSFPSVIWALNSARTRMQHSRFYPPTRIDHPPGSIQSGPVAESPDLRGGTSERSWTSFVELDTFSQSNQILPRSIYTCHQFDFYQLMKHARVREEGDEDGTTALVGLLRMSFENLKKKKVVVRQEVLIEPGDLGLTQEDERYDMYGLKTVEIESEFVNGRTGVRKDKSRTSLNGPMHGHTHQMIYAEPIRSAVETSLPQSFSPRSPNHRFPGFPNGHPGKTTSNPSLMSIKSAVSNNVVGVMNEKVRKEIGRMTSNSTGVTSGMIGGYYVGMGGVKKRSDSSEEVTSVSFEDERDETIRVDPGALFDDQGPSSSSMTSISTCNSQVGADPVRNGALGRKHKTGESELMMREVTPDQLERWDAWSFEEDDFDFKVQPEKPVDTWMEPRMEGITMQHEKRKNKKKNVKTTTTGRVEKEIEEGATQSERSSRSSSALSTSTSVSGKT